MNRFVHRVGVAVRQAIKAGSLIAPAFIVFTASAQPSASPIDYSGPAYRAEGRAIVGENIARYHNRPLYGNNTDLFVSAGDRPLPTLIQTPYVLGSLLLSVEREDSGRRAVDFDRIRSIYRGGQMGWTLEDSSLPGLSLAVEVLPTDGVNGMAVRLEVKACRKGDRLVWAYGGAKKYRENLNHAFDATGHPEIVRQGFDPAHCAGNRVAVQGQRFTLSCEGVELVQGMCSAFGNVQTGTFAPEGSLLPAASAADGVVAMGQIALRAGGTTYWAFTLLPGSAEASRAPIPGKVASTSTLPTPPLTDPKTLFAGGEARARALQARIRVHTPDTELNTLASVGVAGIDGSWYPPVFRHGAMLWNYPYPGWRSMFGDIALGWHDRLLEGAKHYLSFQVRQSDKTQPLADPTHLYMDQALGSRFFGVGYIDKDQTMYNMQTQYFDQLVSAWYASGDPELEKILYPALELHLLWQRECFDPDGDGLYESYRNCWPTDSEWYSGGGSAEETSYAFRGHRAAAEMADLRGDEARARHHDSMANYIQNAFFEKLWIERRGYPAKLVEQEGLRRQHIDPTLYGIFLPITSELLKGSRAAEALYYSEYALENIPVPSGGLQVQTSNFVPAIWSVRQLWPGDNYHLALAYARTGLHERAWDIFRGSFMPEAYHGLVPGNVGHPAGGLDFADCSDMFYRMLTEGLFGYRPDYPHGQVLFAPAFPQGWPYASIETPDYSMAYATTGKQTDYILHVNRPAEIALWAPINTSRIHSVTLNGKPVEWSFSAGYGKGIVSVLAPAGKDARIVIRHEPAQPYRETIAVEATYGDPVTVTLPDEIQEFATPDLQQILTSRHFEGNKLSFTAASTVTHHVLSVPLLRDDSSREQLIHLTLKNPALEAREKARYLERVPAGARWEPVPLYFQLNADVREVYKQEYLSPRPNTVSLRIGTDGYSSWCFPYWGTKPPQIELDSVDRMTDASGVLQTPQGVPFAWKDIQREYPYHEGYNIAFTSRWDNYPTRLDFPVHRKGEALWMLVCGTTNPMQCQIANAVVRLHYADGSSDELELVPPFNYWNLSPFNVLASSPGQGSRSDYTAPEDRFCLPERLPERVWLGENCRAMLLNLRMKPGVELERVELETLSAEVIVGLMGLTVMNPE